MTDDERLLNLVLQAGDELVKIMSAAMAAVDWGDEWPQEAFEQGYTAVDAWRNIREIATPA